MARRALQWPLADAFDAVASAAASDAAVVSDEAVSADDADAPPTQSAR